MVIPPDLAQDKQQSRQQDDNDQREQPSQGEEKQLSSSPGPSSPLQSLPTIASSPSSSHSLQSFDANLAQPLQSASPLSSSPPREQEEQIPPSDPLASSPASHPSPPPVAVGVHPSTSKVLPAASPFHRAAQVLSNSLALGMGEDPSTSLRESQTRQSSKDFKETLDAKTKDEKDGTRLLNQYHLTKVLGQGAYGVVFEGRLRDDPSQVFAVKELSKTRLKKSRRYEKLRRPSAARGGLRGRGLARGARRGSSSDREEDKDKDPLELIRREVAIMKKLDHPNIIALLEVLDDPTRDELYMVFEYCPDGVIIDVKLHERTMPLKEEVARSYFVQILLGIEYLHSNDIIHRDIKPANILLCDEGKTCKIVDFGVSELFTPSATGEEQDFPRGQGTPAFLSPEICSARTPSSKTSSNERVVESEDGDKEASRTERETSGYRDDLWALGVTLYCLVVGHLPFDKSGFMELYEAICHEEPEYPSHLSPDCVDLLQRFLAKDPSKRITVDQAREHPWVTLAGTVPIPSSAKNLRSVVGEITEDELRRAICKVSSVFAVARAVTKFKKRRSTARSVSGSDYGDGRSHSGDRQGSLLWSSSPSSPQVHQRTCDSPRDSSPIASQVGSTLSSYTGEDSNLGLGTALNKLKYFGLGSGQETERSGGEGAQKGGQVFSEEPEQGEEEDDNGPPKAESSYFPKLPPSMWSKPRSSANLSSGARSGPASLTSAINTSIKAIGLGTIIEVNTPLSATAAEGRPMWSRQVTEKRHSSDETPDEQSSSNQTTVDTPEATYDQEDVSTSDAQEEEDKKDESQENKDESEKNKDAAQDPCEIPSDRREAQRDRLRSALESLEARFEARMKATDPKAATKYLGNRLQQAMPLDRLSAGLHELGLEKVWATLAGLTGRDEGNEKKDQEADNKDAEEGKEEMEKDSSKDERDRSTSAGRFNRPEALLHPHLMRENSQGMNFHTGRTTSHGTGSSGVKVDHAVDQGRNVGSRDGESGDSNSQSSEVSSGQEGGQEVERPRLFNGPVIESPLREEMPRDFAARSLVDLVEQSNLDDEKGKSKANGTDGSGGGDDDDDEDDQDRDGGGKITGSSEDGQKDKDKTNTESDKGAGGSADSARAFDSESGRVEGEIDDGQGGSKYVERPAVGDLESAEKHEPSTRPPPSSEESKD